MALAVVDLLACSMPESSRILALLTLLPAHLVREVEHLALVTYPAAVAEPPLLALHCSSRCNRCPDGASRLG